jgi:hypothetical protein
MAMSAAAMYSSRKLIKIVVTGNVVPLCRPFHGGTPIDASTTSLHEIICDLHLEDRETREAVAMRPISAQSAQTPIEFDVRGGLLAQGIYRLLGLNLLSVSYNY